MREEEKKKTKERKDKIRTTHGNEEREPIEMKRRTTPSFSAQQFMNMESNLLGTLTVGQREGRFSVNKYLESLTAVLKGEVINQRKTTIRQVENQARH